MLEILNQHNWLLLSCLLSLGLVVGSFLNVVIYRLPLMMESRWRRDCCELLEIEKEAAGDTPLTLSTPNSHCPHCKTPIKPWQNIPVFSYLFLAGKCSECGVRISIRYPLVELTTAVLTLALAWQYDASAALLGAMIFTWSLVALTMIDVDHQLLPDDITLPLMWLGIAFSLAGATVSLQDSVLGAMLGYLSLWSVYWLFKLATGKEGMGYGDFKLLAALGAWLGWQSIPIIILLSSLVGAVCGIALMIATRRGKDIPIPFGPYLAMAGWIALMWGDQLMGYYLGASGLNT
ncbi:MAG: prepilin peptidase [Proteobacteria bacterium]|nr:prepilin peptidase [Pseudomonadota bacterium]